MCSSGSRAPGCCVWDVDGRAMPAGHTRRPAPCSRLLRSAGCLVSFRGCIGTQPQRDVCWLHSLPDHSQQIVTQGVEVRLVSELGREGFQGLSSVVLLPVEAAVYKPLDAATQ